MLGSSAPSVAAPSNRLPTDWPQGDGDIVTARVLPNLPGQVVIESIEGDGGRLPLNAASNCVGIAAIETLKMLGQPTCGVGLKLRKASY